MANINLYQSTNMFNPQIFYGTVTSSTNNSITIDDGLGKSGTYFGSFLYNGNNLAGGTVTGYTSYNNYSLSSTITGVSLDALTLNSYLNIRDALGLYRHVLSGNDEITGSSVADSISGYAGNDIIYSGSGNDILSGGTGNDTLDGGLGTDTASFNINKSAVTDIRHMKSGGAVITSSEGTDTLINIESLNFLDGTLSIESLIALRPLPTFASIDHNGASSFITPTLYTGPVTFLEYELLGNGAGNVIIASSGNDFMNLLGGDDAANGGLGDDVLDGGTGSNFLTGGGGTDTFFLDGRGGTTTWSTVTDFSRGDQVNIWGWNAGTSKLLLTEGNGGADGYTGATFHYDLDNNGLIDTSITFTGLSLIGIPTGEAMSVVGNGYLLIG
jgi:serralysin